MLVQGLFRFFSIITLVLVFVVASGFVLGLV